MPRPSSGPIIAAAAVLVALIATAPGSAHAQSYICANFFPVQTGRYGDLLDIVIDPSPTVTGTADGVTGVSLPTPSGVACTSYTLSYRSPRLDIQVMGVDPGEAFWLITNDVEKVLQPQHVPVNPWITTQPLTIDNGRLVSAGVGGAAFIDIREPALTQFSLCASSPSPGGVIVHVIINGFCVCGNGNRHFNEHCDDGNLMSGDGCSSQCEDEEGWTCVGGPQAISVCHPGGPDAAVPDAMRPDATIVDASVPDAEPGAPDDDASAVAPDATPPGRFDDDGEPGGCTCQSSGHHGGAGAALTLVGLAVLTRRRRRRRGGTGRRR